MHWIETKITFCSDNDELAVELIANLFYTLGAKGVVVDDPYLEPEEGWGSDALPRPERPAVTGYLPLDDQLEAHHSALALALADLARTNQIQAAVVHTQIDDQDWAESWKAFFWPEKISPSLVVKPTWREYDAQPAEVVIEIDPGMAFGTGTHPTTAMCMQLLEKHVRSGQTLLDVGTGSGILLVTAAKMGAAHVTGVDLDPVAVTVARDNLMLNHINADQFDLKCGHLTQCVEQRYDLVVANILADVVIELLDDIQRVIKPGGLLICSGIIETHRLEVERKMAACGFIQINGLQRQEWVALSGYWGDPTGESH